MTITDRSYCSPRRHNTSKTHDSAHVLHGPGPGSGTVSSPRRNTSPRSPPPPSFNFDCLGTEKSREEILALRVVGPITVLDLPAGYCGRYLVVPRFFSKVFPHLCESSGGVRLSRQNDIDSFFRSDEMTDVDSAGDSAGKGKGQDSSEEYSTENLRKLHFPAAELSVSPITHCNKDVEMSLLGAIFMTVVGGVFIVNIITGRS